MHVPVAGFAKWHPHNIAAHSSHRRGHTEYNWWHFNRYRLCVFDFAFATWTSTTTTTTTENRQMEGWMIAVHIFAAHFRIELLYLRIFDDNQFINFVWIEHTHNAGDPSRHVISTYVNTQHLSDWWIQRICVWSKYITINKQPFQLTAINNSNINYWPPSARGCLVRLLCACLCVLRM